MQIENHLQPNCSEIVLMISNRTDTSAIENVIKTIKTLKLDVGIRSWDGMKTNTLNPKALALLMKKDDDKRGHRNLTNVDKLQLIGELRAHGMPEADISTLLKEVKDGVYTYVMDGKNNVYFRLSDGYGNDGICVMTGDCDRETFPILKKLQDEFGCDPYTVDGGHEDAWNEFIAKEDKGE
jgi:hypothetical protein